MLEIKNITKTYPTGKVANKDISFSVCAGEIVALIGPNGSGKTTLMQQILGVLKIMEGDILVDGKAGEVFNIAYVPQFPAIYPALTVYEAIKLVSMYIGIGKREAARRVENALQRTGLDAISNQPCYTLSGGQKKLLSFAGILVQDSPNLVLDEVTSMVDVITRERIWELILEEQKRGKAILISSHDLSEVKKLSSKIVVLKDGEVVFCGEPTEAVEKYNKVSIRVKKREGIPGIAEKFGVDVEESADGLSIISKDSSDMLLFINEISKLTEITEMSWEYPAIYDGLISLMQEEKRND